MSNKRSLESRLQRAEQAIKGQIKWTEYTESTSLLKTVLRYQDGDGDISYCLGVGCACLLELLDPGNYALVDIDELWPCEIALGDEEEKRQWITDHRTC